MHQFFPHYQPIVDLSDGEIKGYEALARTSVGGKVVSAGPIFVSNDLPESELLGIDRHIRKQALRHFMETEKDSFLTINVSPKWIDKLGEGASVPTIEMIEEIGIDPRRVIIEITEITGDLEVLKRLRAIYKAKGLKVAIDDFGAGASQLDRVAELEPDFIKLDMGLLRKASKGGFKADVLLSLNFLTRRTGCQIICEGVETEEEFHFAIECGADFIQGWIFYPANEMTLDKSITKALTKSLKQSYLQRKRDIVKKSVYHNKNVFVSVNRLIEKIMRCGVGSCDECLDRTIILCNEIREAREAGVIRYYICNPFADQVSPNYELLDGRIQKDYGSMEKNWSHRSYFALLMELEKIKFGRVIVSESYRDRTSGKLCKTYMAYTSDKMILMVDVLVEDMILFAAPADNKIQAQ